MQSFQTYPCTEILHAYLHKSALQGAVGFYSLSTTQGFHMISLRRVLVPFRLGPFPSTTQSFGLISLRRGTEWGIHSAIYRDGSALAYCC